MFWLNFGSYVLASGNDYSTLNTLTQRLNNLILAKVSKAVVFRYYYAFAGIDRLEKRINLEFGIK